METVSKENEVLLREKFSELDELGLFGEDNYDWLELDPFPKDEEIRNPLLSYKIGEMPDPIDEMIGIFMNADYLPFFCRHVLNTDLAPFQCVILDMLWNKKMPMLIGGRGVSKTTMLAVYICLRLIFHPGCKIVAIGAAYRQSKQLFESVCDIYDRAPVFRDIVGNSKSAGPKRDIDRCEFTVGRSKAIFLPIGNGEKIRGIRANYVLCDEIASLNEEVLNVVIRAFAVVSSDPIQKIKEKATINKLKKLNLWTPESERLYKERLSGNQIVFCGTAYYSFNHLYKSYKVYRDIITSRGDPRKLKEVLASTDKDLSDLDYRDYAIMRIPYTSIPESFLDPTIVAQAKATMSTEQFNMEFCFDGGQEIITNLGIKRIKELNIGDMVLTHKGRFRKITKLLKRKYTGDMIEINSYGVNVPILTTPNHPFFTPNKWTDAKDIGEFLYKSNLKELSGLTQIKISDYVKDYTRSFVDGIDYIFAKCSQTLDNKVRSKKYKHCIPDDIKLDYNLGLIFGYYISEGSCGKGFVSFSLDGHVDNKLCSFVEELINAIRCVFGLDPSVYNHGENVTSIFLCNRLIKDFIKLHCPGVSHTKIMNPALLFSNEEFMLGYITGYWHGDGCYYKDTICSAKCVNKGLLAQMQLCLSYFDISSSLLNVQKPSTVIFKGQLVNQMPQYNLDLKGKNAVDLINLTDHRFLTFDRDIRKCKIINDGDYTSYKIKSKNIIKYDDYVYNLEVEEDNSYSLPNATVHNCSIFLADSHGFFKRSVLEEATCNKPILVSTGERIQFGAMRQGDPKKVYTLGVDPAADQDNAAIVLIEMNLDHRKVVHCWTTNRKRYNQLKDHMATQGVLLQDDYYRFLAKKIRDLMRNFNVERIIMDKNGGGIAVAEALSSADTFKDGELPIYTLIDVDKPKQDDLKKGLHMLELISPTADINSEANHGMLKDFQDKVLILPMFDSVEMAKSVELDNINSLTFDTYEQLVLDIEELKNEITTVVCSPSSILGRETFDTPEIKTSMMKKGRLRKDRYSALLYANYYARNKDKNEPLKIDYRPIGGTRDIGVFTANQNQEAYHGPGMLKVKGKDRTNWGSYGAEFGGK